MSTNKTQNYQLHGWAFGDEFPRVELNANFTKLDTALKAEATARAAAAQNEAAARAAAVNTLNTALAGKAAIVTGSYTGDGVASQTINLGFTPKAVLVRAVNGAASDNYRTYSALAVTGQDAVNNGNTTILALTASGFRACHSAQEGGSYLAPRVNTSGQKYNYLAVK